MDGGRRRRVKDVFLAARQLAASERAVRLDELCQGDLELRAEVSSLLEYDSPELDTTPPRALSASEVPDLAGSRVGPFVLLRLLGRGGMGMVWEAEQDRPHRRVAVKILRRGIASSGSARRFEHEAELLARLQHSSIAQVYSAGTFEHRGERLPYFAMELVADALALDAYMRERDLDLRARVQLFLSVCDALHHGHQRGVIHRDIKPSNVLVGPDGLAKVIDFGVARVTDSDVALTQHTREGELVGTLAYMSPEQCNADPRELDSRTDVYSLGVVLYELVCGRPPYELRERSITASVLVIRQQEPAAPGLVDRRLRGDLEAVVLKCLEKDRQRRYSSAAELAADLRRWLAGDPVEARLPGPWRKAVRWIGRHPILTTAAACALLVAVSAGSLFVGSSLAERPWRFRIDSASKEALLCSFSGQVLKRWRAPEGGWITFAELIERPAELGGGKVAALGLDFHPRSGELCLFEMSDLETPYWTSASRPLSLPEGEPERAGTRFIVQRALAADVFPELPGSELVALHRLVPYSATAVRVYDLAGGLHYEAWHDGGLDGLAWLSAAGVLVTAGLFSENSWSALGVETGDSLARYPAVVLALRPELERTGLRKFLTREGSVLDPSLAWYRWLGPPEQIPALDDAYPTLYLPSGSWDRREHAQVLFQPGPQSELRPPPQLGFVLDATGKVVDRIASDPYWRWERAGKLPPPSAYALFDFAELPGP